MFFTHEILFDTALPVQFLDITDRVREICKRSEIANGTVTIFTRHTTSAITINEICERLQEDMQKLLHGLVPHETYRHDVETVDGRPNARSHLMSLLLSTSEMVPLVGGKLVLGTWQSIFFVELDGPRQKRKVLVSILGE